MTAHQDVAGLAERLRVNSCRYAHESEREAAKRRIATDLEAAARLESLSQALREADSRYNTAVGSRIEWRHAAETWQSKAEAAESRLAESMEVIEPFASRNMSDINDCVDNHGMRYQSQWFADATASARAFIAGNGGKDA